MMYDPTRKYFIEVISLHEMRNVMLKRVLIRIWIIFRLFF